jgi:hypothetical protein
MRGKVRKMRALEINEVEMVSGGTSWAIYTYQYPGSGPVQVWNGDDPFSSYIANQKYILARDAAAAEGYTLSRADFFGW